MIPLTFAEVARATGGELRPVAGAGPDTVVSGGVDTDSRLIEPGGLFVAKPGADTDGHLFVGAALERGAVLALVERPVDAEISQIVVADAVAALADLAREVVARVRAGGDLRIVGITGSNGKTTTKNMLARILQDEGETVAPRASFNNEVGAPLTMLRVTADTRYLVSEFGASGPGEIARLAGLVEPDIGVVLMVGMAHAGGFGGVEATLRAKSELIHAVRRGGVAVLNADDSRVATMASIAAERDQDVRWFGRTSAADVRAEDVEVHADGTTCTVVVDGERMPLRLRVLGEHHVMNALAALTAAVALGVPAASAVARLETMDLAERWRMQPLGSERVRIINDAYNASPDSMAAALRTLAQIVGPGERTVAVLGAMSELGEYAGEEHDRIGLLAVRLNIRRIVVIGAEARRLFISVISEGSWDGEAVFFATADEAYDYLMGELRDGDRVLVKSSNSAGLRHLGDRLGESFS
ncbi:UDP-N-acetylmuramoyl-tripeptide--D-alanyl-D-alanine ligase [Microbacterium sp. zg.Y1090]|uniref:UDP-N-acetylmuramoyl-tripeptide--D-alanyl-D- alanine ligase n=1 Tax=Microbacterium TaxID=33882 RepID=UPI00214C772C|nr:MULTISPECIES: UDP-N-acetylmuramoyl-tripeptide--D-alanyl-D-alanine ligase [unclassified Microbacterium]MCR2811432.1 UDP-N-acetylmuramoyl-tripeptide--D-alanyl-D-alanine ligase [Microbacterium sp. zg.Y1084]MCR2819150.1 UDP-N-acetylmuramoyl-tripeptide--D-alanyl-D-alanine ligase [Microbacterium sp. zg.Y1090]MDL5487851.1 UDP-N-acetylmuramoyl-tripeptide--D-alanyl-D-alanine ligase [Microbacterium sp. zg-Y1211]WIM27451.1 UDP-N-acetylmuramoyl-tripeptide--D-alanyl-D-alanine ligase [Microbacterium sp. z